MTVWSWLNDNSGLIGIAIAMVPLVWGLVEFIRKTRAERVQQRFQNYHRLIQDLVDAAPDRPLRLDRQIAVVFELQKYTEYRSASLRILTGFRELAEANPRHVRLTEQIDETLNALKYTRT